MQALIRRIREEGIVVSGDILSVGSFLNHQVDMDLMRQIGLAFADHFSSCHIDRIVTIESSGIAPAGMTAIAMGLPLLVLKKRQDRIVDGTVYQAHVQSYTKRVSYEMTAQRGFLPAGERILLIDDFLAMGEAALGAASIIAQAGCALSGIGIVIEKSYQPGRGRLDAQGYPVYSLARIASMTPPDEITFWES